VAFVNYSPTLLICNVGVIRL